MYKLKCPVCGRHEVEPYDECPHCHWELDGDESTVPENVALGGPMGDISVAEAKRRLASGLDAWGDPLEK